MKTAPPLSSWREEGKPPCLPDCSSPPTPQTLELHPHRRAHEGARVASALLPLPPPKMPARGRPLAQAPALPVPPPQSSCQCRGAATPAVERLPAWVWPDLPPAAGTPAAGKKTESESACRCSSVALRQGHPLPRLPYGSLASGRGRPCSPAAAQLRQLPLSLQPLAVLPSRGGPTSTATMVAQKTPTLLAPNPAAKQPAWLPRGSPVLPARPPCTSEQLPALRLRGTRSPLLPLPLARPQLPP